MTGDCWEREDQEESNINSKWDESKDIDRLSELESNTMHMTQDMQMMKEKMDMMNTLRGRVLINLDELVQQID